MDEKVLIRSSSNGVNGSTVYSFTLTQGGVVIFKEAGLAETAKIIREKYSDLEKRTKNYFSIGVDLPEELILLGPTPQTQLIRQISGLFNAIENYYEHEEKKVLIKDEQITKRNEKTKKKARV